MNHMSYQLFNEVTPNDYAFIHTFSSAKALQESLYKIQYNLTTAHYNTHPDQIDQYNLTKMFVRILATSTLQLVCITRLAYAW